MRDGEQDAKTPTDIVLDNAMLGPRHHATVLAENGRFGHRIRFVSSNHLGHRGLVGDLVTILQQKSIAEFQHHLTTTCTGDLGKFDMKTIYK